MRPIFTRTHTFAARDSNVNAVWSIFVFASKKIAEILGRCAARFPDDVRKWLVQDCTAHREEVKSQDEQPVLLNCTLDGSYDYLGPWEELGAP
jgi:hypothetical protein